MGVSQKFLSVLFSIIIDSLFLELSDTELLKILNDTDQIRIPKNSYECSIKFLYNELIIFEKKNQKIENKNN